MLETITLSLMVIVAMIVVSIPLCFLMIYLGHWLTKFIEYLERNNEE